MKSEAVVNNQIKVELLREPYLQNSFADSISILWKTNAGEKSFVKYGKTKDLNSTSYSVAEKDGDFLRHTVTLKGLDRGEKYFYAIYSDDQLLASGDDYYFRVEPLDKNSKFSFYAMGDIGEPVEKGGFPQITSYQINSLKEKPNFGIGLGDIIYPDGESLYADEYLFKPMEAILRNIPFYPALGNHDWKTDPDLNFEKEWKLPNNEHYYSYDYGNAHFIALDTRNGELFDVENQVKWFENDLIQVQGKHDWIFVYFHHNGRTCTYKKDEKAVIALYPLFSKYNVDVVLNGHAHTYERLHPYDSNGNVLEKHRANTDAYPEISNGFIQITTGAGGKLNKNWQPQIPGECDKNVVAAVAHTGHFSLLTVEGKKLHLQAISTIGGVVLDSFTMNKN
ncbi:metallophosphoesterase family protein [Mariniflexile litorale]|uniref:Metallophosphoesterase family protein n=1 Tax=Mariniflexile litorale TaxID=3045158 RepID=A0AAU7EJJ7_9FLAO